MAWWHHMTTEIWSKLAQVMACCLAAPSHHLSQCWHHINEVLWHSPESSEGPNRHSLQWRHNDHNDVANHQAPGCLLNRLFRRRSKKTSKLRVTCLCVGNSPGPVNSPHKGPVTRKCFHLVTSSCSIKSLQVIFSKLMQHHPGASGL